MPANPNPCPIGSTHVPYVHLEKNALKVLLAIGFWFRFYISEIKNSKGRISIANFEGRNSLGSLTSVTFTDVSLTTHSLRS